MELVKSIEDEKEKLKRKLRKRRNYFDNDNSPDISIDSEESPRIFPTTNYNTNFGNKIPKLNFQNLYHTVKDVNHITLHNINSNRSYNDNPNSISDFEKLKEDYFNLYEEKKQMEIQLIDHLDCPRKLLNVEENLKGVKLEVENAKKRVQKLTDENSTLQERIAKLTKENVSLTEVLKSTRDSLNICERDRINMKNKISLNQNKHKVYEKEIMNSRKKMINLNNQIKNLTMKLKEESDEKILLEKKLEDIVEEFENKIVRIETDKQKAIKDSLSTLMIYINEENCMDFIYNKKNNKIEIYFDKEKIAEVNNSDELHHYETDYSNAIQADSVVYLKTDQTVKKILSPLKSKKKICSVYQNEDSKDIDQVAMKKLFSQHTYSSARSIIDNSNKENIDSNTVNLNLMSSQIKLNSNGNSFRAKRLVRKDTFSSNKMKNMNANMNKNGNYLPTEIKKNDGPNPFDFNFGRNLDNCIQRTNLNNSLRYVLSSSNHIRHRKMISLNIALGDDDRVNECDDILEDVTTSIRKLNFFSTTKESFEIRGLVKIEENNLNVINNEDEEKEEKVKINDNKINIQPLEIIKFEITLIKEDKIMESEGNLLTVQTIIHNEKEYMNYSYKDDNERESVDYFNQKTDEVESEEKIEKTPRSHRSVFSYE